LSKLELVQALEQIIGKNKEEIVNSAVKKMKDAASKLVGSSIKDLDKIERHPVILILDKVRFSKAGKIFKNTKHLQFAVTL
jgi:hypothetical protein